MDEIQTDIDVHSTMMVKPLLLTQIVDYAASAFGYQEIVSFQVDGEVERLSFSDFRTRCLRAATALRSNLGVTVGEPIATFAWTNRRHLELYFAVPGVGAIIHTVNPRYSDEQIIYILNHTGNRVAFVEADQEARLREIAKSCPRLQTIVVLDSDWDAEVDNHQPLDAWPEFPETNGSSMCYTSGTTGNPKGVVYSHRSTMLYSLSGLATGKLGLHSQSAALMCVPMYHVNGWSKPFQAMLSGSKIVLPGQKMDGDSLIAAIDAEAITCGFGVPTIWLGLVECLRKAQRDAGSLKQVSFGGGAVPRSLLAALRDEFGVAVETGYGMTETTAGLGLGSDGPDFWNADNEKQLDLFARQRPIFGIDLNVVGNDGGLCPADGESSGELQVRGHFAINSYFRNEAANQAAFTRDGWFRTGDVVTVDAAGRIQVQDRLKDLVKSGGEWINSVVLEQAACAHPEILEAAVIGLPHSKWSERPMLCVRRTDASDLNEAEMHAFMRDKVQSWWCPDAIIFVSEIPKTATGKIDKKAIRLQFSGCHFDESGALKGFSAGDES